MLFLSSNTSQRPVKDQSRQTKDRHYTMDALKELFPNVDDQKLQLILDSAQDDLELATSMLLSELSYDQNNSCNDTDGPQDHLAEVKQMFPDMDSATVEQVFRQEKGMVPNVITHLLNLEYLKNEPVQDDIESYIEPVPANFNPSPWNNTKGDVEKVSYLLNWPENNSIVIQQYQENHFNPRRTIISMILNGIHPKLDSTTTATTTTTTPQQRHKFGRVQTNRSFAHRTKQDSVKQTLPSLLNSNTSNNIDNDLSSSSSSTNQVLTSYNEFLAIIRQDKECQGINPQFVSKLFQYFQEPESYLKKPDISTSKTNLENCFRVLSYVLDDPNGIALTFNRNNNVDEKSWHVVTNKKNKHKNNNYTTYKNLNNKNEPTVPHPGNNVSGVSDMFQVFKVDFHGYTPQQAVNTLNRVVTSWWDEELKQRELNKVNLHQQKVAQLEHLKVITGRGIHSIGGRSPVRFQVKRYLDLNGYLYHEEPSFFEIYGKKRGK